MALTALLAATLPFAAARSVGARDCRSVPGSLTQAASAEGESARCSGFLSRARERPRRTPGGTAVLFTDRVWPEASFETALNADTYAAPGDYALTVGRLRLRARPTADGDRVSTSVEVTNLSSCVLLIDLRFLDGGSYVTRPWLMRVRARRSPTSARPVALDLPDVRLLTPLRDRTTATVFSAEFTVRFVDCAGGARPLFL